MTDVPVTEFEDITVSELHLVGKGANGFPTLVVKEAAAKAIHPHEPGDGEKECPTCKGSGAIRDGHVTCPTCEGSGCIPGDDAGDVEKRDMDPNVGGGVDRDKLPAEDFAGKNRSFPIVTPGDVSDAATSIGRAGPDNYPADRLKANIIAIAKRKGPKFEAELPDAWKSGAAKGSDDDDDSPVPPADQKVTEALRAALQALQEAVGAQAQDNEGWESGKTQEDVKDGKHKAEKAGRRHSAKDLATLRAARDHLNDLIGDTPDDDGDSTDDSKGSGPDAALSTTTKSQEDLNMTKEELLALLDERDARKAQLKGQARKAKKAKRPKTDDADTSVDDDTDEGGDDAEKSKGHAKKAVQKAEERIEEAITKAVSPVADMVKSLAETVATLSAQPRPGGPALSDLAARALRRGEPAGGDLNADLAARFEKATDPLEKARLGEELTKARLKLAFAPA